MTGISGELLLALFAAGFASGVHCIGMCGGIVTAFAAQPVSFPRARSARSAEQLRLLAFNGGRIASYALGGAIAGFAGGVAGYLAGALPAQTVLYVAANGMLVLVGLYLMGVGRLVARLEALGGPLWRRVQPIAARGLAARTPFGAYVAGLAWGWLPCGLVYAALAVAAFTGSAGSGALAMLAFGLGTLPHLLLAGLFAVRLRGWFAHRSVRVGAGVLVLGFGAFGLAHASGVTDMVRRGLTNL